MEWGLNSYIYPFQMCAWATLVKIILESKTTNTKGFLSDCECILFAPSANIRLLLTLSAVRCDVEVFRWKLFDAKIRWEKEDTRFSKTNAIHFMTFFSIIFIWYSLHSQIYMYLFIHLFIFVCVFLSLTKRLKGKNLKQILGENNHKTA